LPRFAKPLGVVLLLTGSAGEALGLKVSPLNKFTTDHPQLKSTAGFSGRTTSEDLECCICSSLELAFPDDLRLTRGLIRSTAQLTNWPA
jgi:hypothetical protein